MNPNRNYPYGLFDGLFRGWWLAIILTLIGFLMFRHGLPGVAQDLMMASRLDSDYGFDAWRWFGVIPSYRNTLLSTLLALPGSWLVDRYGPRRVAFFGLPVAIVGYLTLIGASPVNWVMYLSAALLIIGSTVGFSWVPAATLNHWFHRRKATAMAIPIAGFSLWRWAIGPALDALITSVGWRLAAVAVGTTALAIVMPLAWQIRDNPEERGLHPDGLPLQPGVLLPEYTWLEAAQSRTFWLLVVGDACILSIGVPLLVLSSQVEFESNGILIDWELINVVMTAAILAGALLADRIPIRYVLAGLGLVMVAAVVLLVTGTPVGAYLFEIIMPLALGGSSAVRLAARGVYFGRRSFATIAATGLFVIIPFQPLAAFGLLSLLEFTDSTLLPLLIGLAGCLVGSWAYLVAGPPRLAPSQQPTEVS